MKVQWKVHTASLLKETLNNPGCAVLAQPFNIFGDLLSQVAQRAIELDDPQLNILMLRLTLYEQADPNKHTFAEIAEAYRQQEARLK